MNSYDKTEYPATPKQFEILKKYKLSADTKKLASEMISMLANNNWNQERINRTHIYMLCSSLYWTTEQKSQGRKRWNIDEKHILKRKNKRW